MSYCMVIDLRRCVGCGACSTMCKQENGTRPGVLRSKVMRKEEGTYPQVKRVNLPLLCMHCEEPPCVDVCPSGATEQNSEGIVVVNKENCVGCKACMTACPYAARALTKQEDGYFGDSLSPYEEVKYAQNPAGVVDKCDFCHERLKEGLSPACVQTCVATARIFGQKQNLLELIHRRNGYQLRPEMNTNPNVYYLP